MIITPLMPNYSGYIIVISSDNSMGEKYRAVEDASPYRCGGIIFVFISKCCNRGGISSTGERCSPLHIILANTEYTYLGDELV